MKAVTIHLEEPFYRDFQNIAYSTRGPHQSLCARLWSNITTVFQKNRPSLWQACSSTTIVREYPDDYGPGKEAYYPIPTPETAALYQKYAEKAAALTNVSFIGRLATYRYYNMDQVVGMALAEFEKIKKN